MCGFNKNQGIVPIFGFIQYVMYKMTIFNLASWIFLRKLSILLNSIIYIYIPANAVRQLSLSLSLSLARANRHTEI